MQVLTDLRESAGVPKRNKFFFGRFAALTPIRACDSLRKTSQEAALQNSDLLKSTKLRKYTATLSQILDLGSHHKQWLADHLGHNLEVHDKQYRLPSSLIEKAKIAKLLIAIDCGKASSFKGKTLDEIDIDGELM